MLEWKILAAAFSALLVISILLVGNTGVKDLFGGIVGKITDWLGGSSISLPGGLGKSGLNLVSVTIYPRNFTLSPGYKLNLTLGESSFENFNGELSADFEAGNLSLKDKSGFSVSSPIQPLAIPDMKISRLTLKEMKFSVQSVQSNITNENGSLDIQGFSGVFLISASSITLSGNVTKITGDGWNIG
jgi:hypothetical protein